MSRIRDIAKFLGKTEATNTTNVALAQSGEGVTVYTALDSLPSTGLTSGDQAWVESSGRLYISNGSGWYNIALVNATPTLTLDQSGTIQLNADTLTVTVTASATDSDDNPDIISFSVESDGNMVGTGTTVSQDSSVFTITALSADSGGTAGTFTLTFKATDQIAVDNETLDFSLTFTNVVDSSNPTVLLLKAIGDSADNATMTYKDSANSAGLDFTVTGNPRANSFTPYRTGGYSHYFQGDDRLVIADDASLDMGTGDFTVECWIYIENDDGTYNILSHSASGGMWLGKYSSGFVWRKYGVADVVTATSAPSTGEWHHIAVVRSSSNTKMYIDGTQTGSTASDTANYSVSASLYIGDDGGGNNQYFDGYIRDLRIVKGSAVYTSNFTPPTEPLEEISGTSLLACATPYVVGKDLTGNHSITMGNRVEAHPFGPYDYTAWADSDGGSIYFDGSNDYLQWGSGTIGSMSGDFTVEGWVYHERTGASYKCMTYFGQAGSNRNIYIGLDNSAAESLLVYADGDGELIVGGAKSLPAHSWNHIALVRDGTTTTAYVNGVSEGTTSSYSGVTILSDTTWRGLGYSAQAVGTQDWQGYIADFRVINGTAKYTAAFTPPKNALSFDTNTKILQNSAKDTKVYDAAATVGLLTSGAKSDTGTRKWTGSSSVEFDGTDDHIIWRCQAIAPWFQGKDLFEHDFTVEAWVNQTSGSQSGYRTIFGSSNSGGLVFSINNGTAIVANKYGQSAPSGLNQSHTFTAGTWYHVALTNIGGTYYLHVDGTLKNSGGTSWTLAPTARHYNIGAAGSAGVGNNPIQEFAGHIQDLRVSRVARYGNADFTAPTAEFEL